MAASTQHEGALGAFRHEALLYAGMDGFLAGTASFVREALAADEPVMVAVNADKLKRLRSSLGPDHDGVLLVDMSEIGRNPARIIPAWQDFLDGHAAPGRRLRGIGEPVWHGRSEAELEECHRDESLINVAFGHAGDFWLLCPYDLEGLDASVIENARASHPYLAENGTAGPNERYQGLEAARAPFEGRLAEPTAEASVIAFETDDLAAVRELAAGRAAAAGLGGSRLDDLVLAIHEIAANSIRHGGGRGSLRVWSENGEVVCEIADSGRIAELLAGRVRPTARMDSGRGLWLANHLCDLVQIRSAEAGTVIRLHMTVRAVDGASTSS